MKFKTKQIKRQKRHRKTKAKIHGTSVCPRVSVFKSDKNIYINMVDDSSNKIIMSFSSLSKECKEGKINGSNVKGAAVIGEIAGKKALEKGIKKGIFDRSGYRYHGRIKALDEGLKKA
jgi:large subunit ribosomal protein L18